MNAISKLKLVAVQADRGSPTISRRNKLSAQIQTQIAIAKAHASGSVFAATRKKAVQDLETGERKVVEVSKRVKQWWFNAPNGKIALALRYGAKPLELAKGKNAVEVSSVEELVATLEIIQEAVLAGELDAQIEQAAGALRAGFAKKK